MFPEEGPHAGRGVIERMAVIGQDIIRAEENCHGASGAGSPAELITPPSNRPSLPATPIWLSGQFPLRVARRPCQPA